MSNEKRNMSEDTTTTTTSEDLEDNSEAKYSSSRQAFRKPIVNSGRSGHYNTASVSGNIDNSASMGVIQNNVTASTTSRKKEHNNHHHHHHHHHR